jgi:hypothetical protein
MSLTSYRAAPPRDPKSLYIAPGFVSRKRFRDFYADILQTTLPPITRTTP